MSTVFPHRLRIGDLVSAIDSAPLEPDLASLPAQPPGQVTSFPQRGYVATRAIHEGTMYLAEITSPAHALLFADTDSPVAASWLSGFIHGWRGDARSTGYPARRFRGDGTVLETGEGKVLREWILNLRSVPDQTGEELYQSWPSFLFKTQPY